MTTEADTKRLAEPTRLQRAEQLWAELQQDELGGYSGINRPFWIAQALAAAERRGAEMMREAAVRVAKSYATCGCNNAYGPCNADDQPLAITEDITALPLPGDPTEGEG